MSTGSLILIGLVILAGLALAVYGAIKDQRKKKAAPEKKEPKKVGALAALLVIMVSIIVFMVSFGDWGSGEPDRPLTEEEMEIRYMQEQFGLDGQHFALTRLVKKKLYFPESFQHIKTSHVNKGKYIEVTMRYKAKTRIGAIRENWITAEYWLNGRFKRFVSEGK